MQGFLRVSLLALAGAQQALAQRTRPNAYCVDGCAAAFGLIQFEGALELDYYVETCQRSLFVNSLVYCALAYCSPYEVSKGLKAYNTTCKAYSPYSLKPEEVLVAGIDAKTLAAVPRVAEGSTEIYSKPAIPDRAFFEQGLATARAFDNNINDAWYFGYACIGYWCLVLLIGMVNRAIVVVKARKRDQTADAVSRPLQLPQSTSVWLRKNLIIPGTFGGRVQHAFWGFGTIPPRLETLLLVLFVIMNFIFLFPGHDLFLGNVYYPEKRLQLGRYIADRSGILSAANFPAVWLFAARNDPFLWLTGWSFASYNRFHRWVARVATIHAIIHSIAWTIFELWNGYYYISWKDQYWYMGGVAVVTMSLLLGFSVFWLRDKHYDFFLVIHVVLAIVTLVGLWYHIRIFASEYTPFVWFCAAMWCFDRFLRYARIVINSILPKVTRKVSAMAMYSSETDLVRIDVTDYFPKKDAQPGIFYYIYEPTFLRGWESHPFTLCSWVRGTAPDAVSSDGQVQSAEKEVMAIERTVRNSMSESDEYTHTFLVRPYAGFTKKLRDKIMRSPEAQSTPVTLLLEGPYGDHIRLHRFTDILVVAGGSGITAAVSHSCALLQAQDCSTKIHIIWAVRQMALVEDVLRHELSGIVDNPRVRVDIYHTPHEEAETTPLIRETVYTVHDGRPHIEEVLATDRQSSGGSLAMICCGPPALADACRSAVVDELSKPGSGIEFVNDAMGW